MRFSKPVAIEDTVTFTGTVTRIEGGVLEADITATNQRGEAVLKHTVVKARL